MKKGITPHSHQKEIPKHWSHYIIWAVIASSVCVLSFLRFKLAKRLTCSLHEPLKPQWGLLWIPRKFKRKKNLAVLLASATWKQTLANSSWALLKYAEIKKNSCFFSQTWPLCIQSHTCTKFTRDLTRVTMWTKIFQMPVAHHSAPCNTNRFFFFPCLFLFL